MRDGGWWAVAHSAGKGREEARWEEKNLLPCPLLDGGALRAEICGSP